MNRRRFLALVGLGLGAAACGSVTTPGSRPEPDAEPGPDGGYTDAASSSDVLRSEGAVFEAGPGMVVVRESFMVLLNDTSCSGHDHSLNVTAGAYPAGVPVRYLGGSHTVQFTPEELLELQAGGRLPFATILGGGHGHCGLAWRSVSYQATDRSRVDHCTALGGGLCVEPRD